MGLVTLIEPVSEPVTVAEMNAFLRLDSSQDDTLTATWITAARRWCENYTQRRFQYTTMRLLMDFFPGYVDFKMTGARISSPFVSGSNAVLVGIRYAILLPYPTVARIVNFQYLDANGNTTVLATPGGYIADIVSQPARLMPIFGQIWPVARVISNAVTVDYVSGYGGNISVNAAGGIPVVSGIGFTFAQTDVGLPLNFPGVTSTILSVDASGNATLSVTPAAAYAGQAYLGKPVPTEICIAIKLLVAYWNENRVPNDEGIPRAVTSLLTPYRDLRL